MFSGRPSVPLSVRACVRACVRPSVCDSHGSFMFPRYLQYMLTDFRKLLSSNERIISAIHFVHLAEIKIAILL